MGNDAPRHDVTSYSPLSIEAGLDIVIDINYKPLSMQQLGV